MAAPGGAWLGSWHAIGHAIGHTIGRAIVVCAAAALIPSVGTAQTEISKGPRRERAAGQTEIIKSRPRSAEPQRAPEQAPAPVRERAQPPPQDWSAETNGQPVTATDTEVSGNGAVTRFSLQLTGRVPYHLSKLVNPYRIVVDLPDVDFHLPVAAGEHGGGLIRAYRYGLFAPGKARIVIDTTQPVHIQRHAMNGRAGGARLVLELVPTDAATFMADVAPPPAVRPHETPGADEDNSQTASAPNARPVIVIDPGHGGPDPGAVGVGFREKDVVLAVSHEVRAALEATGRYDVQMTRTNDVFITLGRRVAFTRSKRASLFVSIHANSVPTGSEVAGIIRGAAVYTLSEEASTREAQRLAEKENAADLLAGADSRFEEENADVDRILADLKWRETSEFSADFRGRLLTHMKRATLLSREPAPSAAFMVLRQSECPSVLVELGYISNTKDAQLLVSPQWQRQVGRSIATAINEFFSTHPPRP